MGSCAIFRKATPITLSRQESTTLEHWACSGKTEQRLAERGAIVLLAAAGVSSPDSTNPRPAATPPGPASPGRALMSLIRVSAEYGR